MEVVKHCTFSTLLKILNSRTTGEACLSGPITVRHVYGLGVCCATQYYGNRPVEGYLG